MKAKVIIADDHPLVISGITMQFKNHPSYQLVATACNGAEALAAVKRYKPDVLLLDIKMPVMNGWQVLKQLKAENNPVQVIVLSMFDRNMAILYALQNGAHGFVSKTAAPGVLFTAIDRVLDHQIYADSKLIDELISFGSQAKTDKNKPVFDDTELELLSYVVKDIATKDIALKMLKSVGAIDEMRSNLIKRCGCEGIIGVVFKAFDCGFLLEQNREKGMGEV